MADIVGIADKGHNLCLHSCLFKNFREDNLLYLEFFLLFQRYCNFCLMYVTCNLVHITPFIPLFL